MDVILVNAIGFSSENTVPQLGLLSLKNVLSAMYETEIVNFDALNENGIITFNNSLDDNIELMVNYLLSSCCDIIGFYTICNTYPLTIEIAKRIKKANKKITIIFGGPQASLTSKETLEAYNFVDIIAIGEGEKYIVRLIQSIKEKRDLSLVPNIAIRTSNGSISINDMVSLLTGVELEKYAVMDIEEYNYFNEEKKRGYAHNIEAGRGCPYGCTFCSTSLFWGRSFRVKTIDAIINEMIYFKAKYGIKNFRLEHDLFTARKSYVIEFCNTLEQKKNGSYLELLFAYRYS